MKKNKWISLFLIFLMAFSMFVPSRVEAAGGIKNLKVDEEGTVSWDPFPGVYVYQINFLFEAAGGTQKDTSFSFKEILSDFQMESGEYGVQIQALDSSYEVLAEKSITWNYKKAVRKPMNVYWDKWRMHWYHPDEGIVFDVKVFRDGQPIEEFKTNDQGYIDISHEITGSYHEYYFTVKATADGLEDSITVTSGTTKGRMIRRLYGKDRYGTTTSVASVLRETLDPYSPYGAVVLASGSNFPDALSGSYLARTYHAPLLLISESSKDRITDFIVNNVVEGSRIYVLGGTGAVPDSCLAGLSKYDVKRLSGKTRYDTNLAVLNELGIGGGKILVCTGENFADSLSASALPYPMLLVKNKLNDAQKEQLSHIKNPSFIIIGGSGAVPAEVENELKAYGTIETRISGKNRYETSLKITEYFFSNPKYAVLATGKNYPDGLSGGPLAVALHCPLILVDPKGNTEVRQYLEEKKVMEGYVLGGTGAVSDAVLEEAFRVMPLE